MIPSITHIIAFAGINLLVLILGYVILKLRSVLLSWLLFILVIPGVYIVFMDEHPVMIMLAIIATTFSCMKVIAVTESYRTKPLTLNFKQWLIYATGWVGMRAEPFENLGGRAVPGAAKMVRYGISRVILGVALIFIARNCIWLAVPVSVVHLLVTGLLMVGFSLILHFGVLSISAGMWRYSGVNTYMLFKQPAKATSLTEFWSKRWNIAFSEMTSIAIFRPLKKYIGSPAALIVAFIFSGFLHELALSVPVKSGYGLPTIYFIIQVMVVLTEKWMLSKRICFLQNHWLAHVWVFFWIVIPAPLLFHHNFITQVIWPLAGLNYNF